MLGATVWKLLSVLLGVRWFFIRTLPRLIEFPGPDYNTEPFYTGRIIELELFVLICPYSSKENYYR